MALRKSVEIVPFYLGESLELDVRLARLRARLRSSSAMTDHANRGHMPGLMTLAFLFEEHQLVYGRRMVQPRCRRCGQPERTL